MLPRMEESEPANHGMSPNMITDSMIALHDYMCTLMAVLVRLLTEAKFRIRGPNISSLRAINILRPVVAVM